MQQGEQRQLKQRSVILNKEAKTLVVCRFVLAVSHFGALLRRRQARGSQALGTSHKSVVAAARAITAGRLALHKFATRGKSCRNKSAGSDR
jgi:hypothetical protein